MRIGLAQIDTRVGDLAGNAGRILAAARAAADDGADLIVFPELCVTGYPPRDLLLDDAFVSAALGAHDHIARALARRSAPPVVLGSIARSGQSTPGHPGLYNALVVVHEGRAVKTVGKRLLPAHDVFHETRWFVPGPPAAPALIDVAGRRVGLCVCEDLWSEGYPVDPPRELRAAGAEILVCSSASPYRAGVLERRMRHARRAGGPLVYVNTAGAEDELIFDGGSFALNAAGEIIASLPRFEEAVEVIDVDSAARADVGSDALSPPEEMFRALALGVRGFAQKNGVRRAFLGLSGGVDSAVVACVAKEALGPGAVTAIAMPSRYTDPRSTESARALSAAIGAGFEVVPIEPLHAAFSSTLAPLFAGAPERDTTDENIQARVRAVVLMAYVNRFGGLLLNTSNKTELSLGYGTLYGDMAGTLSVLGDVIKTEVFAIARWLNSEAEVIPRFILDRPPSAELRPDQVDPFDYGTVAPLVEALVQGAAPKGSSSGSEIARLRALLRSAEHKRFQAGIVLKVSERAFGTGRMMPVTRVDTRIDPSSL